MMRRVVISLFYLLLSGCAVISTGARVGIHDSDDDVNGQIACRSYAGSYSLPKSFIKLKIDRSGDAANSVYTLGSIEQLRREDPLHTYCLDYNASPTAQEKIYVVKSTVKGFTKPTEQTPAKPGVVFQTNLLHYVSTDIIDRSRVIAQTLIKTLFRGLAGAGRSRKRDLLLGKKTTILDIEFDPFVPMRMALVNDALREYGFCVMLGGFTVDLSSVDIDEYCDSPIPVVQRHPPRIDGRPYSNFLKTYQERIENPPSGILYRPEISYNLYVFGKENLRLDGGWQLRVKKIVNLENISPIVSVGVDRSFFAKRRTTLVFKGGILMDVCIYKTSELLEIVQIPLTIAQSIVVLPTQIFQLRIDDVKGQKTLIEKQELLINAQREYLAVLNNSSKASNATPEGLALPKKGPPTNLFLEPPGLTVADNLDRCPKPQLTDTDPIQ